MLDQKQISQLKEYEKELLFNIDINYGDLLKIDELIQDNTLHIIIQSPIAGNDIELFYDGDLMVLSIGEWSHTHPVTIDETIEIIEEIINDEIIMWKVTRPNGDWYSGYYNIFDLEENSAIVDEPDSQIEKGDWIVKLTFNKIIENNIIE